MNTNLSRPVIGKMNDRSPWRMDYHGSILSSRLLGNKPWRSIPLA